MTVPLRPFQSIVRDEVHAAWGIGLMNVLMVLPTGGGKTVVFSDVIASNVGGTVAIAHRQELVSQISMALARNQIRHRIVAPAAVAKICSNLHLYELKRNYVDPGSSVAVAGVDTLVRMSPDDSLFATTNLVVQDEAHHLLLDNKWGKALAMFKGAVRCLGVTATPGRADGKGLGRHSDGVMDYMVMGPTMRTLINDGWLTDYRVFAPPSDLDLRDVPLSASGDFSPPKLAVAVHKSHIVGDVVTHYQRIAPGKLGVTFAVDVASATEIAAAYRAAGVSAEVVTAETPDQLRASVLRRFRAREVLQLVNVDLFGEGFDLPAIEVVSMARPTQSYGLYAQQFGRALRILEGKDRAIVIDHVGNVHRHGLPDVAREWSLDRRQRRASGDTQNMMPVTTCSQCLGVYERYRLACPFCGNRPEPTVRTSPAHVDGNLIELSPEVLMQLRGQIDAPPAWHPDPMIAATLKKRHREAQEAQAVLRASMAQWGGARTAAGESLPEAQKRFYLSYGVDVLSAQALNAGDAEKLNRRLSCS